MSNTTIKHSMLRLIAQKPRELRDFTDANERICPMYPRHAENLIAEMRSDGWIKVRDGKYRITWEGVEQLRKPTSVASPRQLSHKGTTLVPARWTPARATANDHMQIRSLGPFAAA